MNNEIVFTPSAVLDLLKQIDELSDYDLSISESENKIQLKVGQSVYDVDTHSAEEVQVDQDVVDTVSDVNEDNYEQMAESGDINLNSEEPINSGVLRTIADALLIGGMIKLTSNMLKK